MSNQQGKYSVRRTPHPEQIEPVLFEKNKTHLLMAAEVWITPYSVHRPGWLKVHGGRVVEAGTGSAPVSVAEAPDHVVHELGFLALVPGLIDAHVHLELAGRLDGGLTETLRGAWVSGLAGLRDGGDRDLYVLQNRSVIEPCFGLAASGTALYAPGRYGSFIGRAVSGPDEIKTAIAELARAGVDQIKVLASGPVSLKEFGRVGPPQFSAMDIKLMAEEAQAHGLPLMAHANGPEAVAMCIRAGARSVEHGYFMGPEVMAEMADSNTAWTPTIVPLAALVRQEEDPAVRDRLRRIIDRQVEQLILAETLGVRIFLGSDAGSPGVKVGAGFLEEMAIWSDAGLPPRNILAAATEISAEICNLDPDLGSLEPGRRAVVAGFPLTKDGGPNLTRPPVFVGRPKEQTCEAWI